MQTVFTGPVYVVRDNIDTDQIISAQFLNLVPTIPEEYEKLGSYALAGLPESLYPIRYVKEGQLDSDYPIVVAGIRLPSFLPHSNELHTLLWNAHRFLALCFFALIVLHIAAALFHALVRRDGVFQAMASWRKG